MNSLPEGWTETSIGAVSEINPKHSSDLDDALQVSFVPMGSIDEIHGSIGDHSCRPLGEVKKGYTHFADGDVIFAKITPCMENGNCAVAENLNNGIACGSTEFFVFRPNGALDPKYLYRYLRQERLRQTARKAMTGAVGQARVPKQFMENTCLPLPPLNEQRRIVAKLDALFERSRSIREKLDRLPRLLANLQKSILNSAFRGDLTKEWRKKNQLSTASWQSVTVAQVANTVFDGPFGSHLKSRDYVDSGIRVVRLENIGNLRFHRNKETYITQEKYNTLNRHRLQPRDILFSSFVDEEVRVCIFPEDMETEAINKADCFCIRPNEHICNADFLSLRLSSNQTYKDMKKVVHGATRPRINLSQLKSYSFVLPSLDEQREIVRLAYTALERIRSLADRYTELSGQYLAFESSSLQAAFRGELVPQDPKDEPAPVLLERIRAQRPAAATKRGRSGKFANG